MFHVRQMKGRYQMDMNQIVNGVVLNKACSIKAFKDSDTSKTINLRVKFDGISLSAVFAKAVSSAVIQWQNGPGRSKYDQWSDKQTVDISFKAPGAMPTIDPEVAIMNKAKAMSRDDKLAYIAKIKAQMEALEETDSEETPEEPEAIDIEDIEIEE